MTEPIFTQDPFDPPSVDEPLASIPPEEEFEFDIKLLSIRNVETADIIQQKVTAGWSPDILCSNEGIILFMFSRKKPCTEEK